MFFRRAKLSEEAEVPMATRAVVAPKWAPANDIPTIAYPNPAAIMTFAAHGCEHLFRKVLPVAFGTDSLFAVLKTRRRDELGVEGHVGGTVAILVGIAGNRAQTTVEVAEDDPNTATEGEMPRIGNVEYCVAHPCVVGFAGAIATPGAGVAFHTALGGFESGFGDGTPVSRGSFDRKLMMMMMMMNRFRAEVGSGKRRV